MVVMDENRDFKDEYEYLLNYGAMIKRDRNHPSVRHVQILQQHHQ
jgi:hypothetical protein